MQLRPNKIRAMLREGQIAYGTCMCAFSPNLVELAGFCGYDWCRIDNEHAWRQDETLEHMIRAAVVADIVPLVRIDRDDPYLIRKVLEIGAGGLIVPAIHSADEVRAVVAASKFPPRGGRGISSNCFSGHYGTVPGGEWIRWSNEEPLIGVMIETRDAVNEVEEIMAIEGLDFVLFGPADYSMSIGLPTPSKEHPDVQEAIRRTGAAALAHGKHAMIGISAPWDEQAAKYSGLGYHMIEIGHDYSILRWAWTHALAQARGA